VPPETRSEAFQFGSDGRVGPAVPAALGGSTVIATDDIAGVHYPINKLAFGALDTATLVSVANPLPTVQTGALPAGTNIIGRTGDATDLGRVTRNFMFDTPAVAPAAEALQSVTQWFANAAVVTTTQPAVVSLR